MSNKMRITAAAVVLAGAIVLFGGTLVRAVWYAPETTVSPETVVSGSGTSSAAAPAPVAGAAPAYLTIPALGIHAHVQDVGVTAKGAIGTPDNFTDVAWYTGSPQPGEPGKAILDGHVDNGLGLAGVFKHLSDVSVGDSVYVETKQGETLHFVVNAIQVYPYTAVPEKALFSATTSAQVVLITCEGAWVPQGRTYDHRLVVFATLRP